MIKIQFIVEHTPGDKHGQEYCCETVSQICDWYDASGHAVGFVARSGRNEVFSLAEHPGESGQTEMEANPPGDSFLLESNLADFQQSPFPVLSGTARDGGGYVRMSARLSGSDGSLLETILLAGETWSYRPTITQPGTYQIIITAVDRAGNYTLASVFEVIVH